MKSTLLLALVILAVGGGIWAVFVGPLRDPKAALGDFIGGKGRAEDQLTDPLVLAGPRVRPVVLAAIADPAMPRRRYALSYLGCVEYTPAIEALRRIASDDSEFDYFRADALEALWRLDQTEAEDLARQFQTRSDLLGQTASRLMTAGPSPDCRPWLAALIGRHD